MRIYGQSWHVDVDEDRMYREELDLSTGGQRR